jgi:hypothetical protein
VPIFTNILYIVQGKKEEELSEAEIMKLVVSNITNKKVVGGARKQGV